MTEEEEPAEVNINRLDPETVLLHAAAIVQHESKVIDAYQRARVDESARGFVQDRRAYAKMGKEIDEITGSARVQRAQRDQHRKELFPRVVMAALATVAGTMAVGALIHKRKT